MEMSVSSIEDTLAQQSECLGRLKLQEEVHAWQVSPGAMCGHHRLTTLCHFSLLNKDGDAFGYLIKSAFIRNEVLVNPGHVITFFWK